MGAVEVTFIQWIQISVQKLKICLVTAKLFTPSRPTEHCTELNWFKQKLRGSISTSPFSYRMKEH